MPPLATHPAHAAGPLATALAASAEIATMNAADFCRFEPAGLRIVAR